MLIKISQNTKKKFCSYFLKLKCFLYPKILILYEKKSGENFKDQCLIL